jgi:hypothetical protein
MPEPLELKFMSCEEYGFLRARQHHHPLKGSSGYLWSQTLTRHSASSHHCRQVSGKAPSHHHLRYSTSRLISGHFSRVKPTRALRLFICNMFSAKQAPGLKSQHITPHASRSGQSGTMVSHVQDAQQHAISLKPSPFNRLG